MEVDGRQGGTANEASVDLATSLTHVHAGRRRLGSDLLTDKDVLVAADGTRTLSPTSIKRAARMRLSQPLILWLTTFSHNPGIHAVTVPGAPAAYHDTVDMFGSNRLTLGQLLEPAINLAERGFPVAPITSHHWQQEVPKLLRESPQTCHQLLVHDEHDGRLRAPRAGEIIRMPELAASLRALADGGKYGFYRGEVARAIVHHVQERGGVLEMAYVGMLDLRWMLDL